MGICFPLLELMLDRHEAGASFRKVATLGRQTLYVHRSELAPLYRKRSLSGADEDAANYWGKPADDVLAKLLGVEELVSIDYSGYEGASVIHDMNYPISNEHDGEYDAVIDGGTLEHVFNFPVAIANCMRMIGVGGHFFSSFPANNYCGHGFYQFSFELFFRLFNDANGFEIVKMLAMSHPFVGAEQSTRFKLYEVPDPATIGGRLTFTNNQPVLAHMSAEKTSEVEPFSPYPLQSDYVATWADDNPGEPPPSTGRRRSALLRLAAPLLPWLPMSAKRLANAYVDRWSRCTLRNRKFFRRLR